MRRFEPFPDQVEAFIEEKVRRDAIGARELSQMLLDQFGIQRGKSWLASYIRTTLRPRIAENARLERRLRLLRTELADQPEALAKSVAAVMTNTRPVRRRRRVRAGAR